MLEPQVPADSSSHAFIVSTGRCGSTLLSHMLGTHPELLSLSEFFSMLGGPRAFAQPVLNPAALWSMLGQVDPDLSSLLSIAKVPEILADASHAASGALTALDLVTLPQLTDRP